MGAESKPEVWLIRCEGGEVIPMELPLGEGIAQRIRTGALVRVNSDGTPWVAPEGAKPEPAKSLVEKNADEAKAEAVAEAAMSPVECPAESAKKAEWVRYAASTGQITEDAANDLTKVELVARFGAK